MWPWRGYDRGVGSWVARVAGDGVIIQASSNQDKALPMTAIRQGINQAKKGGENPGRRKQSMYVLGSQYEQSAI